MFDWNCKQFLSVDGVYLIIFVYIHLERNVLGILIIFYWPNHSKSATYMI